MNRLLSAMSNRRRVVFQMYDVQNKTLVYSIRWSLRDVIRTELTVRYLRACRVFLKATATVCLRTYCISPVETRSTLEAWRSDHSNVVQFFNTTRVSFVCGFKLDFLKYYQNWKRVIYARDYLYAYRAPICFLNTICIPSELVVWRSDEAGEKQ